MPLPTSGPLNFTQIDTEFNRGTNLGNYRGVRWYTPIGGSGNFSNTDIKFSEFYGKQATPPAYTLSFDYNSGLWQRYEETINFKQVLTYKCPLFTNFNPPYTGAPTVLLQADFGWSYEISQFPIPPFIIWLLYIKVATFPALTKPGVACRVRFTNASTGAVFYDQTFSGWTNGYYITSVRPDKTIVDALYNAAEAPIPPPNPGWNTDIWIYLA